MIDSLFVSIDGNNTGKLLEKYIFCNKLDELSDFSATLTRLIESIRHFILTHDGTVYAAGGDNVLALVPSEWVQALVDEVRAIENDDIVFSVGIGQTAVTAYLALKYAKSMAASYPVCCFNNTFAPYPKRSDEEMPK